jgi:hypothetical protein
MDYHLASSPGPQYVCSEDFSKKRVKRKRKLVEREES